MDRRPTGRQWRLNENGVDEVQPGAGKNQSNAQRYGPEIERLSYA